MPVLSIFKQLSRAAAAATILMLLHASASAVTIVVPPSLQTAATQKLVFEAWADGVQIYTCNPGTSEGAAPAWVFKAPEATLSDTNSAKTARHYAGPTWEAADGSRVVGKVKASATPTTSAIPWLLLDVKSTEGNGMFSKITAVQRLATDAGKAPDDGCSASTLGVEVRVPYKAVYRFYTGQ